MFLLALCGPCSSRWAFSDYSRESLWVEEVCKVSTSNKLCFLYFMFDIPQQDSKARVYHQKPCQGIWGSVEVSGHSLGNNYSISNSHLRLRLSPAQSPNMFDSMWSQQWCTNTPLPSSLHLSIPAVLFWKLKIFFYSFSLILGDTEAFPRGHLISLAFLETKAQQEHLSREIKLLDASQRKEMPWYQLYRLQTL